MLVKPEDTIMDFHLSNNHANKSDYTCTDKEARKKQDSRERSRRYRQRMKNDPQRWEVHLQKDKERKKRLRQQRSRLKLNTKAEFQGKIETVFTYVFSLSLYF